MAGPARSVGNWDSRLGPPSIVEPPKGKKIEAADDHPLKAANSGQAQGSLSTLPEPNNHKLERVWVGARGERKKGRKENLFETLGWNEIYLYAQIICKLTPCWAFYTLLQAKFKEYLCKKNICILDPAQYMIRPFEIAEWLMNFVKHAKRPNKGERKREEDWKLIVWIKIDKIISKINYVTRKIEWISHIIYKKWYINKNLIQKFD